jgi:hypothetical protein
MTVSATPPINALFLDQRDGLAVIDWRHGVRRLVDLTPDGNLRLPPRLLP